MSIPVIVGAAVVTQRVTDPADGLDAIGLMIDACRSAAPAALLASAGLVAVPRGTWRHPDAGRLVADALGAPDARTLCADIGVLQTTVLSAAIEAVAQRRCEVAIVVGGEASHRRRVARRLGQRAGETVQDPGVQPDVVLSPAADFRGEHESAWGLDDPFVQYALMDDARRRRLGVEAGEHRRQLAQLWSQFSAIAAANPDAWDRRPWTPAELLDETRRGNRMLASPYTAQLVTQMHVDQAAAVIVCSTDAAERAGVPPERWVHPVVTVDCEVSVPLVERAAPGECAQWQLIADALDRELPVSTVDLVDLYSCFPVAVSLQRDAFGLGDRTDLTVTGGMTFGGGPLNNAALAAVARCVTLMQAGAGASALVTAVSGLLTKQGALLLTTGPPARPYRRVDLTAQARPLVRRREVVARHTGSGVVEAATVVVPRDGDPEVVALVRTADGRGTIARGPAGPDRTGREVEVEVVDGVLVGALTWGRRVARRTEGVPFLVYEPRPRSLLTVLDVAARWGGRTALVHDGERLAYAQLGERVERKAAALAAAGVRPGDRVLVLGANGIGWVVAFWAVLRAGGVVVLGNGWWSPAEVAHAVEVTTPTVVVADERSRGRVPSGVAVQEMEGPAGPGQAPPMPVTGEDDPAMIQFTSGTTGAAKGAVLSHRSLIANQHMLLLVSRQLPEQIDPDRPAEVTLQTGPLFHVGGIQGLLRAMLTGGTTVFLRRRFDPAEVLELVERERVVRWGGAPTMVSRVLAHPDMGRRDLSSLTHITLGGAPTSVELAAEIQARFPAAARGLSQVYGMSEAGGTLCAASGRASAERPGVTGRPLPLVELRIDAPGPDGVGEVLARTPTQMNGYWGGATDMVVADGWLRTGDLGRLDADGYLHVTGRSKDVIIRGGENIAAAHVEATLLHHPDVAEVAVVGLPDPDLGEIVAAAVVPRSGAALEAGELAAFAAERLAHFEVPVRWRIAAEPLPVTATGKIDKPAVRTRFEGATMLVQDATTLVSTFRDTVARRGDAPALRDRAGVVTSWTGYGQRAGAIAAGLRGLGVGRGDHVVLMVGNRPEFHWLDVACLLIGAVPVSVYDSPSVARLAYIVEHCAAVVCVAENATFRERAEAAAPGVRLVGIDPDACGAGAVALADLLATAPLNLDDCAAAASPADTATLIYTSGTSGPPKGVLLSHRNLEFGLDTFSVRAAITQPGFRQISYLPMAHIGERFATHYFHLRHGSVVTCSPRIAEFGQRLAEVRPHLLFGAPRMWEMLHTAITTHLRGDDTERAAFEAALTAGGPRADVVTRVLARFGVDELLVAIVGSAPLPRHVQEFWLRCGVPLADCYGQTESSGMGTWDPRDIVLGTCGRPLDGVEVRIGDPDDDGQGEVQLRSPSIFEGYYRDPERTAAVRDTEGWFHTGDLGRLDGTGNLVYIGRTNDTVVPTSGHNVSPTPIEAVLVRHPLVAQACVLGTARPFVGALLVLDAAAGALWARDHGIDAVTHLAEHPDVLAEIAALVTATNADLPGAERIRVHRLVADTWELDSDVLTPTGKMKRRGVAERYATAIEQMYDSASTSRRAWSTP